MNAGEKMIKATFFIMKDLENKPYHFLLNGQYLEMNKQKIFLKDIYGIIDAVDYIYCIMFDFYIPVNKLPHDKIF